MTNHRQQLLDAMLEAAETTHPAQVSREWVAHIAGLPSAYVWRAWGGIKPLREAAIKQIGEKRLPALDDRYRVLENRPRHRRQSIVEAGLRLARSEKHYTQLTREDIAREAACSVGSVTQYAGPMPEVRDAIVGLARKRGCLAELLDAPFDRSQRPVPQRARRTV